LRFPVNDPKVPDGGSGWDLGTICLGAMVGAEGEPPPPALQARFSPDGFWWWDGAEWKPALSQDRLWRWTGQGWVPARPAAPSGTGAAIGLTIGLVAAFVGILVVVSVVVIIILFTMGDQIANVFSNVAAALGG
jgi:Flp pilus assembly pilin Flp